VTTQELYHALDNGHHRDLDADLAEITRPDSVDKVTNGTARECPTGFIARLTSQTKARLGKLARLSARPFAFRQVTLQVDAGFLERILSGGLQLETRDDTPEYKRWRDLLHARVRKAIESVRRRHAVRSPRPRPCIRATSSARHSRSSRRTTRVARAAAKKAPADPDEPRVSHPKRDSGYATRAHDAVNSPSVSTIGGGQ